MRNQTSYPVPVNGPCGRTRFFALLPITRQSPTSFQSVPPYGIKNGLHLSHFEEEAFTAVANRTIPELSSFSLVAGSIARPLGRLFGPVFVLGEVRAKIGSGGAFYGLSKGLHLGMCWRILIVVYLMAWTQTNQNVDGSRPRLVARLGGASHAATALCLEITLGSGIQTENAWRLCRKWTSSAATWNPH